MDKRTFVESGEDQKYSPFIDGDFDRFEISSVVDGYLRQREQLLFCNDSPYEKE